ncbi:response regulator transcription factor [Actinomycetospora corticicola]|uniref:DNA-binding NarL/FixJ family response regulator n=1 Tax=Actinomycetospora corticicola TaxID=663602 RepID=A0A7Y9J886_9PSEU|nr:helix-turn-helix transcriptional regulator [Actinomycetospora corticicola]NYD39292.1 DNA-binding NarL/FixJ family response regulator [Actinomycetospora corticicola]
MRTCVVHDEREQTRRRLELLLAGSGEGDEVVVADDLEALVARVTAGPADVVVLGLARSAQVVAAVRAAAPAVPVLVAGPSDDPAVVAEALAAGAAGYLRWDAPRAMTRTLAAVAVGSAAAGDLLGPSEEGVHVDLAVQRGLDLSVREVQVLVGVSRGMTNADIGRRLYLSAATVKSHAARLFRKLGATDRAEAVGRAWALGVFRLGP